ncbi:aminotransferase class IV [Propionicicella superfundia]|uniref:aminotransferase class IV n=1 Tax=Propionicicella superfundia TaxID=348582 RepID=UPI000686B72C|nr:aminotransferase class IV [Propionicicella superfundia]
MAVQTQLVAVMGRGVVEPDEPFVTASDLGLTRGDGCFDAMRLVAGPSGSHIDHRAGHMARFARSCAAAELDMDPVAWDALIDQAVAAWQGEGEATIKIVTTRGPELHPGTQTSFLTVTSLSPSVLVDRQGMSVVTLSRGYGADLFADVPWLLGGVKVLAYAVNMAASRHALAAGAREALFVSSDGYALEAPTAALLWRADDTLWTTRTGATGILHSITAAALLDAASANGVATGRGLIRPAEITEGWLASAVRGVCPITALDGRRLEVDPDLTCRLAALAGF